MAAAQAARLPLTAVHAASVPNALNMSSPE
jgi:hypothetical protein